MIRFNTVIKEPLQRMMPDVASLTRPVADRIGTVVDRVGLAGRSQARSGVGSGAAPEFPDFDGHDLTEHATTVRADLGQSPPTLKASQFAEDQLAANEVHAGEAYEVDAHIGDSNDTSPETDNLQHHPRAGIGSRLYSGMPIAVILGGLTGLCMLAVLSGGEQVQQGASQTSVVAQGSVEASAPRDTQPTAMVLNTAPVNNQPVSEAIAPAPVFQAGSASGNAVSKAPANTPAAGPSDNTNQLAMLAQDSAGLDRPVAAPKPAASGDTENIPQVLAERMRQKSAIVEKTNAELQMLQGENERLKEKMAALESETLSLNSELLQLELSLAEASERSQPRQVVETRTVYNFVNVPVGGGVTTSGGASMPSNYVDNSYNQYPVNNQLDQSVPPGLDPYSQPPMYDPNMVADMPPPEMGWTPENQYFPPPGMEGMDPAYMNGADPYFDQSAFPVELDMSDLPPGMDPEAVRREMEEFYKAGGDLGALPPPKDLRGLPPIN